MSEHLACEVAVKQNISGGQVSVDEVLPGQVAHTGNDVFTKLDKQAGSILRHWLLCDSGDQKNM